MKNAPNENTAKEPKPSRTDQVREVVEEYANQLREFMNALRQKLNWQATFARPRRTSDKEGLTF
jgi:hypothetical protein